MFDRTLTIMMKSPLELISRVFIKFRIKSTWVTLANIPISVAIFLTIIFKMYYLAVVLILINRLFDGLDGSIARLTKTNSVSGGYLDIVIDYIFYASVPLAHGLLNSKNVLGSCLVLFAYVLCGVQFMACSASANKLGINSQDYPQKNIYYPVNIIEGFETIVYSIIVTLFPMSFPILSYIISSLLILSLPLLVVKRYKEFRSVEMRHLPQSKDTQ